MHILPAIDLYDKKAVRLLRGDYRQMTVYSDCPLEVAKTFAASGASWIHMVDLEGARDGTAKHLSVVEEIVQNTALQVEIGGGIRTMETVDRYIGCGASRVILGTAAVTDEAFLRSAVEKYGNKIAVGADIKDGFVAIRGWLETSALTMDVFLSKMQNNGIKTVICTDISRDGAMQGTNLTLYRHLAESCTMGVIASGGVSTIEDIRALRKLNLYGAIIGKAYYTGDIDLKEAIEVAT